LLAQLLNLDSVEAQLIEHFFRMLAEDRRVAADAGG